MSRGQHQQQVKLGAKVPPQNLDIERAVLGAMMLESRCIPEVLNSIHEQVFYLEAHRAVFRAILRLYDRNLSVDIVSVHKSLADASELNIAGGAHGIGVITKEVVSSAGIETHCKFLLELWMKREAAAVGLDMYSEGMNDGSDAFQIYDVFGQKLSDIQEVALKGALKDMSSHAIKVYNSYESTKISGVLGIQTGFDGLDQMISGLVAPDLIILAARPGQGKTSFALSITHEISVLRDKKIPGAWFSLEMDAEQLTRKLISMDGKLPLEAIRKGQLTQQQELHFFNSMDKISHAPIYIEDNVGINVRQLRTRLNVLKKKHGVGYAVVDYLQLMEGIDNKNKNRENIISEISRGLKKTAKELQIPIIALSQLSREVEKRPNKMPQLSDLRESGAIEQDADVVLFLMRPDYYGFNDMVEIGGQEYSPAKLCILQSAKNRHGSVGTKALYFEGSIGRFYNHPDDSSTNQQSTPNNYF